MLNVVAGNGSIDLKLPFAEIEWNQNETLNIGTLRQHSDCVSIVIDIT